VRHALRITPDSSTATVRTRVIFTLSSTPVLPKPYSVSWRIGSDNILRSNTDTLSYTFATLGVHALTAIYIDSTGTQRDTGTSIITIADTITPPPPPPPTEDLGAFRFSINNETFDRSTLPFTCTATANMIHDRVNGIPSDRLGLNFVYSSVQFPMNEEEIQLSFTIRLKGLAPSTYAVTQYVDESSTYARLDKYPKIFNPSPGGTIAIASIDTVRNIVSGSFSVVFRDANDPNVLDTVKGTFSNMCLILGMYGQGSFTADANGIPFRADNNYPRFFSAEYNAGTDVLALQATDNSGPGQSLDLSIYSPKVGTFPLAWPPSAGKVMVGYSAGFDNYGSMNGASGSVTITKYDTVTRRVSGTFSFTAKSNDNSKTITVSEGVIDNVMWARE